MNYAKKGFLLGLVITFLLVLIPSFVSPKNNYDSAKLRYEGYNTVIQNCGNNPSDECLELLCEGKGYDGFCEAVNYKGSDDSIMTWRDYTSDKKPEKKKYIFPSIENGFGLYGTIGIFGFIILVFPIIVGYLIGKGMDRNK